MAIGLVLADSRGKILGMNEAAQRVLPAVKGLLLDDGVLALPHPDEVPSSRTVEGSDGRPPLKVTVEPLVNGSPKVTHVVVTLAPMLPERERLERHLSFQYNMTGAEIRLAWTVIEGLTPAEAAKTLGITIFTVRTYLKRLYAKTGVHSNAALTRLLLKLASEY